jgi:hypothetical protein
MAFLTIFTAPKPFTDPHIKIIQRNAIQSWMHLQDVAVTLIGDEPGIAETALEFGIQHVPDVDRDDKGVPTVRSVMAQGHAFTDSPLLCYANADMILMSDLVQAARSVAAQRKDFLMVGQRWDLDLPKPVDFSGDWEGRLRIEVNKRGEFYTPWGIDYFVFPRHLYTDVPNFTIGRPAWDNWMVYHASTSWGTAVDATRSVTVIHQTHDYSHLPGNKPPYGSEVAKRNLALAGGRKCVYHVLDTDLELIAGQVRSPRFHPARFFRRLERYFVTEDMGGWRGQISIRLGKLTRYYGKLPRKG